MSNDMPERHRDGKGFQPLEDEDRGLRPNGDASDVPEKPQKPLGNGTPDDSSGSLQDS
jgi:hypothetical protein